MKSIITSMTNWIPVSERLPENKSTYLVTKKNYKGDYYVDSLWFDGEIFYDRDGDFFPAKGVVAWIPLPEPYKKGESE